MTFIHFTSDINSAETQAIIKCWEIFHSLPELTIVQFDKSKAVKHVNIVVKEIYTNPPGVNPIRIEAMPGKSPEEIYFYAKDKLIRNETN